MAARPVLLDTCAAIWLVGGDRMSTQSRDAIAEARSSGVGVHVSPISAWEIAMLAAKGRLTLTVTPDAWFEMLLDLPGMRLAPMPPKVLIASASLPGSPPKDPVDRIVAATAREYGHTLITRDGELIPYARAGHVDAVDC
ncbi:MAG: type II toxin-antitoxin system VapC family toxin [Alphaproteobacteria bacterium]